MKKVILFSRFIDFQEETIFSLILASLRGFCLFIFKLKLVEYRQKKPLKDNLLLSLGSVV